MKNLLNIFLVFLLSCSTTSEYSIKSLVADLSNNNDVEAFYGSNGYFRSGYSIFIDSLSVHYADGKISNSSKELTAEESTKVKKIGSILEKYKISSFRGESKTNEKFLELKTGKYVIIMETNNNQYNWLINKKVPCIRVNEQWFYYETTPDDH